MQLQALLLMLVAIGAHGKQSVEDYLLQHPEISLLNEEESKQTTVWDRSLLPARRDHTSYYMENPEDLLQGHKDTKRTKIRDKRQISISESCHLFFANQIYLVQMQNVPELRINVLQTGLGNAIGVDFDKRDNYFFWSDVIGRTINRIRGDGTEREVLVDTNITVPDGIAWDWVNKKLYWTDAEDRDLEVYDPITGCRKVLIQNGADSRPRAIVLDPSTRYMYWSDWGIPATIERASMDGTNRTVLHNTGLQWPNALTIDYDNQTLYWMDAANDRLESSKTDGSGRTVVSTLHIYHPFGLTLFKDSLFWTDWQLNAILGTTFSDLSQVNVLFGNLTNRPMGIVASCIEKQKNITNPCDGKCSELCLLSKSEPLGYSCICDSCTDVAPAGEAECAQSCGVNGQCIRKNQCSCDSGWRGTSCDEGVCTKACVHGVCTAPDTCSCDAGWEGDSCDEALCSCSPCIQGTCTSPGTCTCQDGWEGAQCDQQTCSVDGGCLNGASCKRTFCDCPKGYSGVNCEKFL